MQGGRLPRSPLHTHAVTWFLLLAVTWFSDPFQSDPFYSQYLQSIHVHRIAASISRFGNFHYYSHSITWSKTLRSSGPMYYSVSHTISYTWPVARPSGAVRGPTTDDSSQLGSPAAAVTYRTRPPTPAAACPCPAPPESGCQLLERRANLLWKQAEYSWSTAVPRHPSSWQRTINT